MVIQSNPFTQTGRHPDTIHKKIQTEILIQRPFSVRLKLAHITKIRVSALVYEQELRLGRPAGTL